MRVKGGEGAKRTREGQELEESRMRAGIKHVTKGRKSACWSYDSHACPLCVCHSGTEKRTENSSPRRRSAVTGLAQRMWGGGKQKPSQSDEVYFQLFCLRDPALQAAQRICFVVFWFVFLCVLLLLCDSLGNGSVPLCAQWRTFNRGGKHLWDANTAFVWRGLFC